MAQRIKGQEVEVLLVMNGQIVRSITAVKSFDVKYLLEKLSEGYLGEKTERKDSIFKGIDASMEVHFDSKDVFALFTEIVNKAKRRTPGTAVNVKATLVYPGGGRTRVLIPNVEFGEIPLSFGSRSDYGTISLDMGAEDLQVL